MGLKNKLPSSEEMQRMKEIVREEMETGVYSLSTGLLYVPCTFLGLLLIRLIAFIVRRLVRKSEHQASVNE
ncbi:hypothetical protein CEB3_c35450 [Peptococcaceae bacterium CEB3]|nr:hypothetical protein CEB3_c35450 [Peptococcaceae bacterium CEB3]